MISAWWLLLIVPGVLAIGGGVAVCVVFVQIAKGFNW